MQGAAAGAAVTPNNAEHRAWHEMFDECCANIKRLQQKVLRRRFTLCIQLRGLRAFSDELVHRIAVFLTGRLIDCVPPVLRYIYIYRLATKTMTWVRRDRSGCAALPQGRAAQWQPFAIWTTEGHRLAKQCLRVLAKTYQACQIIWCCLTSCALCARSSLIMRYMRVVSCSLKMGSQPPASWQAVASKIWLASTSGVTRAGHT